MNKLKISLSIITILWLLGLVVIEEARDVLAHDYLHMLPVKNIEKLPLTTRSVAIPILAASSITAISYIPFVMFWGFVWVWPIFILALIWFRSKSDVDIIKIWVQGKSLYGVIIFVSVILISFSLWLPFRYS